MTGTEGQARTTIYLCASHGSDFAHFYLKTKKKLEEGIISSLYDGSPAKCDYLGCSSTARHSVSVEWRFA